MRMATPFALMRPEHVLDEARAARIEADHGLVDQHRPRAVQEGRGHGEPLLHSVGEALDELVLPARELEQLEQLAPRASAIAVSSMP